MKKLLIIVFFFCSVLSAYAWNTVIVGSGVPSEGGTPTLQQSYESATNYYWWGSTTAGEAMTFRLQASSSYSVTEVCFNIGRSAGTFTETLAAEIWSDTGASREPDTKLADSTTTVALSTLPDSGTDWQCFDFNNVAITSGTYYHIAIRPDTATSGSDISFSYNDSGTETRIHKLVSAVWTYQNWGPSNHRIYGY